MVSYGTAADLVDMVDLEIAQQQQKQSRDGFHDDLFVSVDVNTKPHRMQHRRPIKYTQQQNYNSNLHYKRKPICTVLIMSYSSPGAQVWHVLTRDHTVLPATHAFIHKWNEPYLPLLPSRTASPHFGWYPFPVPPRVGG